MTQPGNSRIVASERIAREIENLTERVRRHPELHHDSADRLLAVAQSLRAKPKGRA
jgi:hypothetical protein